MWLNNTFSRRKRYRVYLRLYLPRPLHLTSPRPRPTRPRVPYVPASHTSRVPYQMSPRPSPRVPKSQVPTHASQCPHPLVPVPLLYTARLIFSSCACDSFSAANLAPAARLEARRLPTSPSLPQLSMYRSTTTFVVFSALRQQVVTPCPQYDHQSDFCVYDDASTVWTFDWFILAGFLLPPTCFPTDS